MGFRVVCIRVVVVVGKVGILFEIVGCRSLEFHLGRSVSGFLVVELVGLQTFGRALEILNLV